MKKKFLLLLLFAFLCLSAAAQGSIYFEKKSYVATTNYNGSYTQTVKGGTGAKYSVQKEGELNAGVDQNGKVWWGGPGGAVIVTATLNGQSASYVITVPYSTHAWKFTDDNISYNKMTANTSDWNVTYKVRQYDDKRTPIYVNGPVMVNGTVMDGDNAYYIHSTAGLLIKSDVGGMGSNILGWNPGVDYDNMNLDQRLALKYTQANKAGLLTLKQNTTLTIPNLKKGQYVRIKWFRYAPDKGDHVQATNTTDLYGKNITTTFHLGSGYRDFGYEFFIVKDNGNVSFTPTDDGWINIYDITVANTMPSTDMRLVEIGMEVADEKIVNPRTYTSNTTVNYSKKFGVLHTSSCMDVKYSATRKEGNINYSISNDGVLSVNGGQGILTIIQEGITDGYTLDRKVTDITIYEKKTVSKTYPFTWDLANNKTAASSFIGSQWKKNDDGSLSLNAKSWDYYEGNDLQKAANGTDINETADLGIAVPRDKDNSLTVKLGKGLSFGNNDSQVLTIPQVKSGFKAYLLAVVGTNGSSISQNGKTLTGATYYKDKNKQIFVIGGTGSDISLTVKNATIEKIGVTGTFKKFNTYNGKSYATEYRDHNERYDLTGIFTNGQAPVTAEYIANVDNDNHLAKTTPISVAPANTGVLLTSTATENVNAVPLFVKDVNTTEDTPQGNLLMGSTTPTGTLAAGGTNYIFTRVTYHLDKDGKIADDAQGKESTLGFYRVATNDDSSLPANKAYLHIDGAHAAKSFYVIEGLFNGSTATDITAIDADKPQAEQGCYYTLTGSRLNGRPTHPGIYVHNGKKVIIK